MRTYTLGQFEGCPPTTEESRPDDCVCWDVDTELPCWPCYRAGFRSQNAAEPATDESEQESQR